MLRELAALPLAEDIPIAHNSCRRGPRSVGWRDDHPAALDWLEAQARPPQAPGSVLSLFGLCSSCAAASPLYGLLPCSRLKLHLCSRPLSHVIAP